MRRIRIGIVGCGKISDAYFGGCKAYDVLEVTACADRDRNRAEAKAREHGVQALDVAELLRSPDIDLVVNLTIPAAHAEVNRAILNAGKHAYCEKPFATTVADGASVLALAAARGLLTGCAPDTFLGLGLQTARAALDSGTIGRPVAALATMLCRGHERWHPSPAFYYQPGGGPMFDMGPYYLTALVNFLGPAQSVASTAHASFSERTIHTGVDKGHTISVNVPTHYSTSVTFASGAVATLLMSFDTWPGPTFPHITIFGESGTLEAPDPNRFDGEVRLWSAGAADPKILASPRASERARGTGVADMAYAILRRERPVRASGQLAQHVLEIMAACDSSASEGRTIGLKTTCVRPNPLPSDLLENELDC